MRDLNFFWFSISWYLLILIFILFLLYFSFYFYLYFISCMRKRLPSIWREGHQNFRKRKRLLPIEEYMETSIQQGFFLEMQSPWTDRYMERKARFYDFLIGSANSKGIRYRDLALKGRHALHKKEREKGDLGGSSRFGGFFGKADIYTWERKKKKKEDSLIVKGRKAHEGGRGAITADFVQVCFWLL